MKERYKKYMYEALKEAKIAYDLGEVPVGAIIVYKNKIIARAYNRKEIDKNAVNHAEILAIQQACELIGDWRLNKCELYVTLEPCLMCAGAILQSRIGTLIYGASNDKFGYVNSIDKILSNQKNNHIVKIISGIEIEKSQFLLQNFFKNKRG